MGLSKTTFSKRIFRRVYYSRYVDNFLLGVRGPKFLAIDARDETSQFIKCNLHLELQLAEVYHAKSNKVKYLGFDIKVLNSTHNYKSIIKNTIAYKKIKDKLKRKKSIVQTHEETFLNQVLHNKITKISNWIKQKTTHHIKSDKIIPQLIQRELLDILDGFTLKSINAFQSTKLINSYKNILNIIKKSRNLTNKLLQKNVNNNPPLNQLTNNGTFVNALEHSLKNLFQTTSNNHSNQLDAKKINKSSDHTIYRTLNNYKHDAGLILYAPKKSILKLMHGWGMISGISNKPVSNKMLFRYHDLSIILYYKSKAIGILEYYKPAKNFYWIKTQVDHQMRHSLLSTLAKKHKTSTSKIVQAIGKNTSIYINNGSTKLTEVASFLSPTSIYNKKSGFKTTFNYVPSIKKLKEPFIKTSILKTLYQECQIKNCKKNNIKTYHFTALYKKMSPNYVIASMKTHSNKIHGTKVVECAFHKKQISLCTRHHLAIHTGKLFLEDLKTNYKSFKLLNSRRLGIKF